MLHENTGGCCVTTNYLHEYCRYRLPIEYCKRYCDQDQHCKGYEDGIGSNWSNWDGHQYCYTATISRCESGGEKGYSGYKYSGIYYSGSLGGNCVGGHPGKGCYIKRMQNNLSFEKFIILQIIK